MIQLAVLMAKKSEETQFRPVLNNAITAGKKNKKTVSRAGVKTSPPIAICAGGTKIPTRISQGRNELGCGQRKR